MDETPDVYADSARISYGAGGVTLIYMRSRPTLKDTDPAIDPEPVVYVRMSHSLAEQVANLLSAAIRNLEEQAQKAEAEEAKVEGSTGHPPVLPG
jgi:hypothetical protein